MALYCRLDEMLSTYGANSGGLSGDGDYWVWDDNWGGHSLRLDIETLSFLHPDMIARIRACLDGFENWEIVVSVIEGDSQPPLYLTMGLIVRPHEIIDGLVRARLPEPHRGYLYADARPFDPADPSLDRYG